MKNLALVAAFLSCIFVGNAQHIKVLTSKEKVSLRGLSAVDDNVIWASGSNGQVARSTDGGKNFEWITVKNYETRDFRDIEAFDANTAVRWRQIVGPGFSR